MVFTRKSQNRYNYVTILFFFCLNIYPGNQQEYLHLLSSSANEKSDGLPIPLILYTDDRSGNRIGGVKSGCVVLIASWAAKKQELYTCA